MGVSMRVNIMSVCCTQIKKGDCCPENYYTKQIIKNENMK